MPKLIDLTGKRFSRLIVKRRGPDYIYENGFKEAQWYCDCDCGKCDVLVRGRNLRDGITTSCGCYRSEVVKRKDYNKYDLTGDVGIGYASNTGNIFFFDLDDYNLLYDKRWYEADGYLYAHYPTRKDKIAMHRLLLPDAVNVDHIDHNGLNNVRSNLRMATYQQNGINKGFMSNNTSGYTGVYFRKDRNRWYARIGYDNKNISLGSFDSLEEALLARKQAENKLFNEWSYFNSTGKETNEEILIKN